MTDQLPAPPLPVTVDLRGFAYMPLDVVRLRDSEIAVKTKGDEFRCAVILWCAAWHQVPAASLPDDDALLADLAGFGRVVREWKRVRAGALRGFTRCSDGRLYHGVVVEKAIDAWGSQLKQRWITSNAALKKRLQRQGIKNPELPEFDLWITRECPEYMPFMSQGRGGNVPRDTGPMSRGQAAIVPRTSPPREGKGILSTSTFSENESGAHAVDNPNPGGENLQSKQEANTSGIVSPSDAAERVLEQHSPLRRTKAA